MKLKLPFLVPPILAIAIVAVYFATRPGDRSPVRTSTPRAQAPAEATTLRFEDPPRVAVPPARSAEIPRAVGGFVERLLSKQGPDELGPLAEEIESGRIKLTPEEIEKLRALLRGEGSQLHRQLAILTLARLQDPDGKNYAALREACYLPDEFLSNTALTELRTYAGINPESARAVNAFLLGFVRSSADEENRLSAISALRFDALDDAEARNFSSLLNDTSEEMRLAVIYSVGASIGSPRKSEALRLLGSAFFSDPSVRIKQQIVASVAEFAAGGKDDEARLTLRSFLGSSPELDPEIEEAIQTVGD